MLGCRMLFRVALAFVVVGLLGSIACRTASPDPPSSLAPGYGDLTRDIAYAHRDGISLLADIHSPPQAQMAPAILLVHGGSWARGDRRRMERIAARAVQRGFVANKIKLFVPFAHDVGGPPC